MAAGQDVALVVSQPDRKRGRGGALVASPVKAAAAELGLPISDQVDDVTGTGASLGVVVAYGRLIRPHVLAAVPMVNIHFSLLPRWRGAAPVERAILAGDAITGVCVMALEEGLDTGPIYAREEVAIGPDDTADDLRALLADRGTSMLVDLLSGDDRLPPPRPQVGEPTYAAKLAPADHRLDWHRPAIDLHRVVRVGQAWTTFRGARLKVHRTRLVGEGPGPGVVDPTTLVVGTGDRGLQLIEVQPEGRPVQSAGAWRNGARLGPEEHVAVLRAKVLTVSDGVMAGTRDDRSGAALVARLRDAGWEIIDHRVTEDGDDTVARVLVGMADGFSGLIVTTGGTGFAPRDLTPEGTRAVLDREAPGLSEAMRLANPAKGRLSRGVAGTLGRAIVVNTPGSAAGAVESLDAVLDVLPHAVALLADRPTAHPA